MKQFTAILFALFAAAILLRADTGNSPSPAPETTESIAAPPQESPMEAIMRLHGNAERQNQALQADYQTLHRRIQALSGIPDQQQRLEEALRLKRMLDRFSQRMEVEREKHIALKNRIDRHVAGSRLLKQETVYLDAYVDDLQLFGTQHEKNAASIASAEKYLNRQIRQLPPPPEFLTGSLGIRMQLVLPKDKKNPPFYVSTTPLTVKQWRELRRMNRQSPLVSPAPEAEDGAMMTDITFEQARLAAGEISRLYGSSYLLPSTAQCVCIARKAPALIPENPVWLQGKWVADHVEKEAAQRFGAILNIIWDPRGKLMTATPSPEPAEAFAGELPQARYKCLGIMLVTSSGTGKLHAIREAEAALDAEEKFQNSNAAPL